MNRHGKSPNKGNCLVWNLMGNLVASDNVSFMCGIKNFTSYITPRKEHSFKWIMKHFFIYIILALDPCMMHGNFLFNKYTYILSAIILSFSIFITWIPLIFLYVTLSPLSRSPYISIILERRTYLLMTFINVVDNFLILL